MKKFSSITRVNSRRTSQNKKLRTIALTALVCIVLLFLLPRVFVVVASVIVAPVNSVKHWVTDSSASLPQYFRNRSELVEELKTLRSEVSLTGNKFTIKALEKENETLRSLLGNAENERILAGIIGRPGVLPYDSLMLDRGKNDGIIQGAPVFIGEDTVIGVVKNATAHTSLVELITTDGFQATVYIIGPDIYTNALGIGGGQMRVGVPQGITLTEGDLVVLPSVDSGVYGEISVVQSEASRPEQYGYVSPKMPIASIRFVSVGRTPLQNISFEDAQEILKETITTVFTVPVPDNILVDTEFGTSTGSTTEITDTHEE